MSVGREYPHQHGRKEVHTAMDDAMDIIQIRQAFQHGESDLTDNINVDSANLLVDTIQGALVHEFHAYADVGICEECPVERDDVFRMAVVHYLEFAKDLLADSGLSVDKDDLKNV